MKKIIYFILALLLGKEIYAQPYSYIQLLDSDMKIVPAEQGTFYQIKRIPSCLDYQISIHYMNRKGDVISSFISSSFYNSSPSMITIDGVVSGNNHLIVSFGNVWGDHYLYELDTNCVVIHKNKLQISNPNVSFHRIIKGSDGYYLSGYKAYPLVTDSAWAFICKLNNSLTLQWIRAYRMKGNIPSSMHINDFLLYNNKLICGGRYYFPGSVNKMKPMLTELDTAGNVVQSRYYMIDSSTPSMFHDYEFTKIDTTPSGHFYILGKNYGTEHALFKITPNYNLAWVREMNAGAGLPVPMVAGYQEDVYISPDIMDGNFILRMDSSGNTISNHITHNTGMYDLSLGHLNEVFRHDCGFLIGNDENMYAHVSSNMNYCLDSSNNSFMPYTTQLNFYSKPIDIESVAFNSISSSIPTQTFSVATPSVSTTICSSPFNCSNSTSVDESQKPYLIIPYPMPADQNINLEIPLNITLESIRLMDMLGHTLYEFKGQSGRISIYTGSISDGVYILSCMSKNNSSCSKVQIRH